MLTNTGECADIVTCCAQCEYAKECRAILKCSNPRGLRVITRATFCSYGKPKADKISDNE